MALERDPEQNQTHSTPMKINLNDLANDLAVADNPTGINLTSAHWKAALAVLGKKLRTVSDKRQMAILEAIIERAGTEDEA